MQKAKIAVAGATGRLGRHVVDVLSEAGHEAVPIARSARRRCHHRGRPRRRAAGRPRHHRRHGQPQAPSRGPATEFFTTAARNLQQAGERTGVARYIVVSIIGIQAATGGYGSAKLAHEQAVLACRCPRGSCASHSSTNSWACSWTRAGRTT